MRETLTKVERTALSNAASIASLLLTTDAIISDLPKKEDKRAVAVTTNMRIIKEHSRV